MERILRKQPTPERALTIHPLRRYESSIYDTPIPAYVVKHSSDGVAIDIATSELADGQSGSTIQPFETVPAQNLTLFKHDFTFGHLADTTDKRFVEVFGVLENRADDADYQSPDMIIESETGHVYVVEFTTSMGDANSADLAARNKIAKYEIACLNRSVIKPISLYVIAVHFNGLTTNLELSDDEVNEIVFRFRLARDIYEELREINPSLFDSDETISKLEREVNSVMSSVMMDWSVTESKFPSFRKELFENFASSGIDESYITSILRKCTDEAIKGIEIDGMYDQDISNQERFKRNFARTAAEINSKIAEMMSHEFLRDQEDHKSTVQFPAWITLESKEGKDLEPLKSINVEGSHPMCKIWNKVCTNATIEKIERMFDDPVLELEYAMSGSTERAVERNKYHRTVLSLSCEEREYAAVLGVCGKKNSNLGAVKEARVRSKKGFSIDHNISRVEEFLNDANVEDLQPMEGLYNPTSADTDLRILAMGLHQPSLIYKDEGLPETLACHMNLMKTPLGSWLQMVSMIGAELSASVKQHVKPNQFIVKRLLGSSVFLLIKPTTSKGHIFVSLAVDKRFLHGELSSSGIFKPSIDAGDLMVTDFVSFKLSKITNLCKASSVMEAAACFWAETYSFEPWKFLDYVESSKFKDAWFMIKLSLLTMMEDKATTEELQTMQRYIIMEGFVSLPEIPKPSKMLSKIPKVLRSELQVFLTQRVFHTMQKLSGNPFQLHRIGGSIRWKGLFNPFSGNSIDELQTLISCCYNGYFKNKEEETEPSALSAMYKKIIELEHLRPKSDRYLGYEDPVKPEMHEFSRSYLKLLCNHAKSKLRKQYGRGVMTQIENSIIREVSSITLERLATLKATSNFNESWYVYKDVKDKNYTRDKLLVKMTQFAQRGKTLAIELFDECMQRIEDKGCMEICLFKKQQHGGLREIYVMGADERIVQSIIEAIARAIGRFFDSDTLCNPSNKTRIPETHGQRAKRRCGRSVWTCATSDDARKWNQGHYVTKFALMLCEFTPEEWWPLIIRGCSMFTQKYMMMNLEFLHIIDSHKELTIEDDFVNRLFKAYHGESHEPWIRQGCTFLQTSTGMMQGILHFTSSLLHSLHQEFVKTTSMQLFTQKMGSDASSRVVCDMMQGSDDSSMIISFPAESEKMKMRYKLVAAMCFRIKKSLGIYAGIYPSEKSTSNTDFVMEYNSEFFFHSQHVRPTIRWIAASCSLPEVETLVARQEEAANLLTAITEGGGSFSLAAMVQQSQCTIHYMLMGLGVSSLFSQFAKAISKWMDPGLGFFLFDNPYSAGLSGFKYNLYKAITGSNLKSVYSFFMKKVKGTSNQSDSIISESCSVSPGGAIVMSSTLRWGSVEKFKRLRSRLSIPDNWKEMINEVPEILYRAPQTGKEIMLRIAEKVHSPGVVSSLSTGNAVCKVMASSVYFLSACIFEDAGNQEYKVVNNDKYSLMQKIVAFNQFDNGDDISQEDLLFLFPNLIEFEAFDSIIFDKGKFNIIPRASQREATQTKIIVFEHHSSSRVPPEKLVSDKWFGTRKSKIGSPGFKQEWERLKVIVRWLRDTPEETLEASPFSNHVQIRNFFARMEGKPRVIKVTGAPVKKRSGMSKIAMAIRDNFAKTGYVHGLEDEVGHSRAMQVEKIKHYLFSILMGPYTEDAKLEFVVRVLNEEPQIILNYNDKRSRANVISLMQRFIKSEIGIANLIEDLKAGIFGAFIKAQNYSSTSVNYKYYGRGIWKGVMDGYQVQIDIEGKEGMPSHLSSITISNCSRPWILTQSLKAWCDDMQVSNSLDLSKYHPKANYWMFNFKMYGSSYPYGCPIYVVRHDITDLGLLHDDDIDIKVRRNTINLFVRSKDKRPRDLHILSYTPSDSDISSISSKHIMEDEYFIYKGLFSVEPTRSWMLCQPLPWNFVKPVLQVASGRRKNPRQLDLSRLREIIRLCTESAIRNKVGTVYSQNKPERFLESEPIDMSEMFDMMLEEGIDDAFEDLADCLTVEEDPDYMDEVDFEEENLHLFGPAHYKEMQSLTVLAHPLMDEFITRLVGRMGRAKMRRLLEKSITTPDMRELSELLFVALDRDPSQIREELIHGDSPVDVPDDLLG
ncbi:RNA-dependent RNA polymerase [Kiborgoch virus]|uniref:RNA-directed RNA polymerase L n=1 Tax=Kiborgoch virus TaxID=2767009 RepID=A0A7G8PYK2_9VIRU|nr:RNA-dependent RNA polymerase [Kiborgoch virus]QNJ99608.1 RNA-dependent RNA polymerase [Kiborgoch virus]